MGSRGYGAAQPALDQTDVVREGLEAVPPLFVCFRQSLHQFNGTRLPEELPPLEGCGGATVPAVSAGYGKLYGSI